MEIWRRANSLVPWLLAGLLLLAVLFLADRYRVQPSRFTSDDLYSVELCRDLLGRGYERSNWHLPYAPQFCPDLLLLLPCVALFKDVLLIFAAYGCLYFGLLAVVLTPLFRQAGLRPREAFLLAGAGVLLLVSALLNPACAPWVKWALVSGGHGGAVLAGLTLWWLVVRSLHRRATWTGAALYAVLGGLAVFSDRLVAAQFLAPMALAVGALAVFRAVPWRKALEVAALAAAAYGCAVALQFAFSRTDVVLLNLGLLVDAGQTQAALARFVADLPTYVRGQTLVVAAFVALLPAGIAAGLYQAWRARRSCRQGAVLPASGEGDTGLKGQGRDGPAPALRAGVQVPHGDYPSGQGALCLAAVLSCCGNLAVVVVTGVGRLPGTQRYLLAALFVPFLFLGFCLRCLPGRPLRLLSRAVPLAALLYAGYEMGLRPDAPPFALSELHQPYPELAAALDRLAAAGKIERGLAGYWNARGVQYLTRADVQLRVVAENGEPWLHLQNPNAYLAPDPRCLQVPHYNFIVLDEEQPVSSPQRAAVLRHYGSPREKVRAGRFELWVYDGLIARPFTLFLRSMLAGRCREQLGCTGPAAPDALARPVSNFAQRRSSRRVEVGPDGAVQLAFAAPVHGALLDVAAPFDSHYEVTFWRGAEALATVSVPRADFPGVSGCYASPGTQSRLVTIPPAVRRRGWTAATVQGGGGPGRFALGHFLVYDGPGLPPSARQMAPGGRWRFESEFQPGAESAAAVVDDPLAGGGKACFLPGDFSGPVVLAPSLFLEPGRYRVELYLKAAPTGDLGPVAEIAIRSDGGKRAHVRRLVLGGELTGREGYQAIGVEVETDCDVSDLEIGLRAHGKAPLYVDRVELSCER